MSFLRSFDTYNLFVRVQFVLFINMQEQFDTSAPGEHDVFLHARAQSQNKRTNKQACNKEMQTSYASKNE